MEQDWQDWQSIKKEFYSKPVYKDKDIKTKIKIYNDEVYADYQNNRIMIFYVLSCNIINIIRFYFRQFR